MFANFSSASRLGWSAAPTTAIFRTPADIQKIGKADKSDRLVRAFTLGMVSSRHLRGASDTTSAIL